MGRRFAKREDIEVLRRPSKRPERFTRDVSASMGMLKRDMMDGRFVVPCRGGGGGGDCWGCGVSSGGRKGCCWASRSTLEFMSAADSVIVIVRKGKGAEMWPLGGRVREIIWNSAAYRCSWEL